MPSPALDDPLQTLLAHTDSRYWQVTLNPRPPGSKDARRWALPADWAQGQVIHPQDQVGLVECLQPLVDQRAEEVTCEYRARSEQNEWRWFRLRVRSEAADDLPRLHFWTTENTRQKRAEQLLALQSRIVQQLATGEQLSSVLEELAAGVEANYFGASVSILGVAPDRKTLLHLAAPSLPKHVTDQVNGLPIGPQVGACGSAAALGQRVIIPDVQIDPRMKGFEELARETGIRSVWSQPIIGEQGEVLGTLAIYRLQVHEPNQDEIDLLVLAANLAALAMENRRRIDWLMKSEERFRELAEKARLVPWEAELNEDRYIYVGPQAREIFGYPLEKWYEPGFWYTIVHPAERPQLLAKFQEYLKTSEHFESEYRLIASDGRMVWVHDFVTIFRRPGKPIRLRGYLLDVTRRKEMEQAIHDRDERFQQLAESTDQGFWLVELNPERLLYVNPAFARIWGLPQEAFFAAPRVGESRIVPEDRQRVREHFNDWLADLRTSYNVEYRIQRPDGQSRWIHDHGAKIFDAEGKLYRVSGIVRDVTEQKRAEAILRESEVRYRLLAENSSDLIMRLNRFGVCLYASPASRLLLGIEPFEIKHLKLFAQLVHPDDSPRLSELDRMFTGALKSIEVTARFRHSQGHYRSLDLQAKVVFDLTLGDDAAGDHAQELLVTVRDATDRIDAAHRLRQREADLAHADRMSTMGQMAAELAHELNQPLYAIANFAKASLGTLDQREAPGADAAGGIDKVRKWLTDIHQQSRRAADVIRRINSFVRKGELDPSLFNLTECVHGLQTLLEVAARGHEATIRYELMEPLPTVRADRLLIEQVIVNLVRNSAEALEDVPAGERQITIRTYRERTGVGLAVSDTGPGFQADVAERLFEPYFTTKESGTGMGLPICRSTIEAHQGTIVGEQNPQAGPGGRHGAQFRVWLPASE